MVPKWIDDQIVLHSKIFHRSSNYTLQYFLLDYFELLVQLKQSDEYLLNLQQWYIQIFRFQDLSIRYRAEC